ncbi:SDR family NAD(P)-dependent oxidoreductase [Nocardia iowensis]|uniref:SDR family NAD(P)-dependent oxidoreductase n=1 Tax=Nocardia iowensis TaxID=204891 RepID=A0ABX8RKX0_NOCIO|nr:SDR family NAD(P)-dependent oxidoreductase [Nocardia iowensis]QXN90235.1 SDR family NAD(P)-dependent oxidoreductase [Nocardia iowensis]
MTDASGAPAFLDTLLDRTIAPGYSRLGFRLRRRGWPADDPHPDAMRGRTALVTGSNSGIGKAIAAELAGLGGSVVLAVRDRGRGEQAAEEIMAADPTADVSVTVCDVSDPRSVADCANELTARLSRLDVLIHNAGVLPPRRIETAEGHETTLATHVLGPLLLTDRLVPLLDAADGSRVILMSSGGMYTQRLAVDDPEFRLGRYSGTTAYARTKRMQVALTPLLAEHYAPQRISVHCMHPGWADTPGVTASLPAFHRLTGPLLRSPAEGADTAVWLAATSATLPSGRFWHDRRVRPEHYLRRTRYTADEAWRLWQFCREAAGIGVG